MAATRLDAMTGSIGADIAGVDAEVRRLRADLESAKEDLQRTHTELAAVQAEANRFSLALTGVKQDLEREGRTCKTLEAEVKELRGEPQVSTRGFTGVQCGKRRGPQCGVCAPVTTKSRGFFLQSGRLAIACL